MCYSQKLEWEFTRSSKIEVESIPVKRETIRHLKDLAYFSSIGLSVALSIFMGLFAGVYLDRWLHTDPWLTMTGLGLGIAAAFRNIAIAIKKVSKPDRKNEL